MLPRKAAAVALVVLLVGGVAAMDHHGWGGRGEDWRSASALLDSQAAENATVLCVRGYCDSSSPTNFQCAYRYYQTRDDLVFASIPGPYSGDEAGLAAMQATVANMDDVWIIFTDFNERDPLLSLLPGHEPVVSEQYGWMAVVHLQRVTS